MVQDAASEPIIYREMDASVRAALAGDRAPLLRLVAQSQSYLHGISPADYFSNGLYFAVSCMDYPQLFSMRSTPAQRREQLAARLLSPPPGAFAPFTATRVAHDERLLGALHGMPRLAAARAHGPGGEARRPRRCRPPSPSSWWAAIWTR